MMRKGASWQQRKPVARALVSTDPWWISRGIIPPWAIYDLVQRILRRFWIPATSWKGQITVRSTTIAKLTFAMLLGLAAPALASGPYDDARQSLAAGDVDSAVLAIDMGAISASAQDENGYTLLHYAAQIGSEKAVKALLDRGADPTTKGHDGKTPFDLATVDAVRSMLTAALSQRGASPAPSPTP